MQWVTQAQPIVVGAGSEKTPISADVLCTTTFSLLAVLLPNIPLQYHHTTLQFICQTILYIRSKTVSLRGSVY